MLKIALFLLMSLLVGCYATTSGMREKRSDPNAGAARTYAGRCDLHFQGATQTLKSMSLDVLSEDRGNGEILARKSSLSLNGDAGDRVAVWFESANGGKACRIRVYGRSQNALGVGGDGWSQEFFGAYKPPYVE